jgi:hypothetical protein
VNKAVRACVKHQNFLVLLSRKEEPLSVYIRSKMVEVAIVQAWQRDGRHKFQGHVFLCVDTDAQSDDQRKNGTVDSLHTVLFAQTLHFRLARALTTHAIILQLQERLLTGRMLPQQRCRVNEALADERVC